MTHGYDKLIFFYGTLSFNALLQILPTEIIVFSFKGREFAISPRIGEHLTLH